MFSIKRIHTILLYSWYHLTHSMETWVDLVWFPVIEVLVFGLLAFFIDSQAKGFAEIILTGLIMWEVVRVVQYSISVGVMWDVWSKSFTSLFISPITMVELMIGHSLSGIAKAIFMLFFLSTLSFFLYGFNLLAVGPMLLVYLLLLSIFSISAGLFVIALILRFGTDIQSLSWSLVYLFQPISAVIFPLEAMPEKFVWISYLSPVTFVMEALRYQMKHGVIRWDYLVFATLGSFIYLAACSLFLSLMQSWAKKTGAFARMEM